MTTIDGTHAQEVAAIRFETTVSRVGREAQDMVDGGVMILFSDPVPPALEDLAVIHAPSGPPVGPLQAGDVVECGGATVRVTAVGDLATSNLEQLGHLVFYFGPAARTKLLPGAVHVDGDLPMPDPSSTIRITRPEH